MKPQKRKLNQNQTFSDRIPKHQFETVTIQAVEHFKESVRTMTKGKYKFNEDPTELLSIEDPMKLFEYLMQHEYWVRPWSLFLHKQVIGLIYGDSDVTD